MGSQSQYTPGSHEKSYTNAFEGHVAQRQNDDNSYGRHHSRQEAPGYGEQERQDIPVYSGHGRHETPVYGGNGRQETSEYGGQGRQETISYGSGRREGAAYGQHGSQEVPSYGSHIHEDARLQAPYGQQETPRHGLQSGGRSDGYSRQHSQLGYSGSSGDYEPSHSLRAEDSHGRDNDNKRYQNQPSYGGGRGSYGTGDQSSHGWPNKVDFDNERAHKTTYDQGGGNEYARSSHKDDGSDSDDNKTRHKHGSRRDDSDNDNRPRRQQGGRGYGPYDGQAEAPSFEQPPFQQQEYYGRPPASGYGPSHGDRDNTFGVERLDIGSTGARNRDGSDSDDDKRHGRRHGHGGY